MGASNHADAATDARPGADDPVIVIGAGPAGLTAALELVRRGRAVTVLEASDTVGGISRTEVRDGGRFDIGGHRLLTKVPEGEEFGHEVLPHRDLPPPPRVGGHLPRETL